MSNTVLSMQVGIRELKVMADIGINSHEIGRLQPLIVSVSLSIDAVSNDAIDATVDYRDIAAAAEALAAQRIALIETFSNRLAAACLAMRGVNRAEVRIDKPQALSSGTASITIVMGRGLVPAAVQDTRNVA